MSEELSITTTVEMKNGKTRFRRIGKATPLSRDQNGLYRIDLFATPLNGGEMVAFAPKNKEGRPLLDAADLPEEMKVITPVTGSAGKVSVEPIGIAYAAKTGQNFMFKIYVDGAPVNGKLVLLPRDDGNGE